MVTHGVRAPQTHLGVWGGDGWTPTSCPGLSRVLVHFFFMSVSSLLGFSPPLHLSPGILRYLKQNRGGEEMLCEPQDPPRPPSHPVVPHGRCSIGDVPAGAQQLAAAVEAELQVVALQLGLLHAHRLVLRAVIAEITAGGGEASAPRAETPARVGVKWVGMWRHWGGTGMRYRDTMALGSCAGTWHWGEVGHNGTGVRWARMGWHWGGTGMGGEQAWQH